MVQFLTDALSFPDAEEADEDGLLAIGGDLSTERLLLAYRNGIFPWYSAGEPLLWWCPHPRFVLFPQELKVSKSMQQLLRKNVFEFRTNTDFSTVIHHCQNVKRKDQDGTWITNEITAAYTKLHQLGLAHCAEAWQNQQLVGGLYGVRLGKVFFGESMFSLQANASKFAFIQYVKKLAAEGVTMIDCQVYTPHLESLGARMIPREVFLKILKEAIP